jgi:exopolysaccharide production protein ExoQ
MFSGLALLFALGFCAFAFLWERRNHGKTSPALWIATLWFMRCASRGVDQWNFKGTDERVAIFDQLFLFVVAVSGFVVVGRRWPRAVVVLRRNLPIVVFLGYIALSVTWSPIMLDSSKRLFRALGDLAMVLIILTEIDQLEAILTVLRRTVLLLMPLSVVLVNYYGEIGRMREKIWEPESWIGVTTHRNCLGQLCVLAAVVFFIELIGAMRRRKLALWQVPLKLPLETIYLGMALYLLNGGGTARSSTSIIALAGAIGLSYLFEKLRSRPRLVPRVLLTLVCVFGLLNLTASFFVDRSLFDLVVESQGRNSTLTGRTDLWADILAVANHPILGSGYMAFWTPDMMAYFMALPKESWGPEQAHNGYLETYIQLGWIGVILLVVLIVHALRRSSRMLLHDFDYGRFRLILLLTALLQNYTESGFPRATNIVWITFLVVALDPYHIPRPAIARKTPGVKREPIVDQERNPTISNFC